MDKYIETVLNRYVIATLEEDTRYLIFKDGNISFTQHISKCTKTASKTTAKSIRDDFYRYTGMDSVELVVLPVRICYEIICEDSNVEGDVIDALS